MATFHLIVSWGFGPIFALNYSCIKLALFFKGKKLGSRNKMALIVLVQQPECLK